MKKDCLQNLVLFCFIFKDIFERPKGSNCEGREGLMFAGRKEGGWNSAVYTWRGGLKNKSFGMGREEGLTVSPWRLYCHVPLFAQGHCL